MQWCILFIVLIFKQSLQSSQLAMNGFSFYWHSNRAPTCEVYGHVYDRNPSPHLSHIPFYKTGWCYRNSSWLCYQPLAPPHRRQILAALADIETTAFGSDARKLFYYPICKVRQCSGYERKDRGRQGLKNFQLSAEMQLSSCALPMQRFSFRPMVATWIVPKMDIAAM